MRPARMRRKVDLPEPDLPRQPTISPVQSVKSTSSSTGRPTTSPPRNTLLTPEATIMACWSIAFSSVESQLFGGHVVEPAPQQTVEQDNIDAQHAGAEGHAGKIAGTLILRDISADARGGERRAARLNVLRHDRSVPGTAGRRQGAGNIGRENTRQDHAPPPQPAPHAQIPGGVMQLRRDRHR